MTFDILDCFRFDPILVVRILHLLRLGRLGREAHSKVVECLPAHFLHERLLALVWLGRIFFCNIPEGVVTISTFLAHFADLPRQLGKFQPLCIAPV